MRVRRPALGHLLSYTALTVILTAGAAQSLAGSNTVDTGDIVDGQVTYGDIRSNAVTGSKILDNSITGADIKDSTLALTCPSGLAAAGDVCYGPIRTSAGWYTALPDCADERLRLPSIAEGRLIEHVAPTYVGIWTDNHFFQGTTEKASIANQIPGMTAVTDPWPYRCVTSIGARP